MQVARPENLKHAIDAVNAVNRFANDLRRQLLPIFQPFIGKQVVKKDGSLLDKIQKLLPPIPHDFNRRAYKASGNYRLSWDCVVRIEHPDNRGGTGHEEGRASADIGPLRDGILEQFYERDDYKTDYDLATVEQARKDAKAAKRAYDEAAAKCQPFGEWNY